MPTTRRSSMNLALTPLDENIREAPAPGKQVKVAPATPGKQVKQLKTELEKKDAENSKLQSQLDNLTKALDSLTIMKEKINDVTTSVPKKETLKKKNDEKPKPAMTAYKYFMKDTTKQDGMDMRKVWKESSPEIRTKYTSFAEADKIRFIKESKRYEEEKFALEMYYEKCKEDTAMEFYDAHVAAKTALVSAAFKKGKKNSRKDTDAPKRPISSYMYFAKEKRQAVQKKNPQSSPTEISKLLGEMWMKLEKGKDGKNGTKIYDDIAALDKVRYVKEKEEYDVVIKKRNAVSEQEDEDSFKQDKIEAMKLMNKYNNISADVTKKVVDEVNQYKEASAVITSQAVDEISDDVKKVY